MLAAGNLAWEGAMSEATERQKAVRVYFGEH
jgi:hypothetical protein